MRTTYRRKIRQPQLETSEEMPLMVRTITRMLLPLVLMFGFYIISYGQLTPGGGFQGGMILVGGVMSLYLAYGYIFLRQFNQQGLDIIEYGGMLVYLMIGLAGALFGNALFRNFLHGGQRSSLLSGGTIPLLNFTVAFKVASGTLIVILMLLEALKKGEE
jgi:multisubunit Na+/H+ antiporter MnhB subunit